MIKKTILLFLMFISAFYLFADRTIDIKGYEDEDYTLYKEDVITILEEVDKTPMGELTIMDIREISYDLSIPYQKMQYVKKSKVASAILPGLGQYMNDDNLSGTLFMVSNIATIAGTFVLAHNALPDELQFGDLNYYKDSKATIKDSWEDQSLEDMMPAIGIMAAGFAVNYIIRYFSAVHAGDLAQKKIKDNKIQFEPKLKLPAFDSFKKEYMGMDDL